MQRADDQLLLAERLRRALIECATAAHEDARLQGLCCDGAWEAAHCAMLALDLRAFLAPTAPTLEPSE